MNKEFTDVKRTGIFHWNRGKKKMNSQALCVFRIYVA